MSFAGHPHCVLLLVKESFTLCKVHQLLYATKNPGKNKDPEIRDEIPTKNTEFPSDKIFLSVLCLFLWKIHLRTARWAPTSYKWGVITPINGLIHV